MVLHFPGALNVNDLECNPPVKSALYLKDHAENPVSVAHTDMSHTYTYRCSLSLYMKHLPTSQRDQYGAQGQREANFPAGTTFVT